MISTDAINEVTGDPAITSKFMAHLQSQTTRITDIQALTLLKKAKQVGIDLDGVNAIIAGGNMFMITYHGFKNKVLETYPESQIDIGLVREGDDFKLSKESGSVMYSHSVGDPFSNNKIIGAYAVFKNKRGEFIETLNSEDFGKMKSSSRNTSTWDKWESEFWLKSVIKRACKRHFYDIVNEIDNIDNDQYGLKDESATDQEKKAILEANK